MHPYQETEAMNHMETLTGFECTWEEYKKQASQFFRRLKSLPPPTTEQVENGLKALRLAFIYVTEDPVFKGQALIVLNLAHGEADKFSSHNK